MTASFIAWAPQIRDQIGVSVDRFGLLMTVAASLGVVASLIAGRIIHAASTRRVLQVGGVVMVLCLLVIGAAESPLVWTLGMLVYFGIDVLVDISMNLQGSWISARRRTPVMNRLHGLWSLGTLAGGLGAVAANSAGLSPLTHLTIVGALMAVALVFVARNLLPSDEEGHADVTPTAAAAAVGEPSRPRRAPIVLLVFAGMFAVVAEVTGGDWATFRLSDDFGAAGAIASLAFVGYTVGMTVMRFGGDWLQLRLGRPGLHHLSLGLATAGFVLAALVPVEGVSLAGFVLIGLGVATFMPKLYDDAARLPGRRGAGLGAMTAGMRVAFLVTPVAVGALAGTSLSVGEAIAVFTLPSMVGLAIVTEWSDRLRRRQTVAPLAVTPDAAQD